MAAKRIYLSKDLSYLGRIISAPMLKTAWKSVSGRSRCFFVHLFHHGLWQSDSHDVLQPLNLAIFTTLSLFNLLALSATRMLSLFLARQSSPWKSQIAHYLLPPIKDEVNAFACVRLSVCLYVSKITQKRVHGFGWNVACRQMSRYGRTN